MMPPACPTIERLRQPGCLPLTLGKNPVGALITTRRPDALSRCFWSRIRDKSISTFYEIHLLTANKASVLQQTYSTGLGLMRVRLVRVGRVPSCGNTVRLRALTQLHGGFPFISLPHLLTVQLCTGRCLSAYKNLIITSRGRWA